jgi:hypothetical protein
MKVYYLSIKNNAGNNASSKAKNDIEEIFKKQNWEKLNDVALLTSISDRNLMYFVKNYINARKVKHFLKGLSNSIIFCQYPINKGRIFQEDLLKAGKKNKLCFIIHDVEALRNPVLDLKEEINLFNQAFAIVVHNQAMKKKLEENGLIRNKSVELNVFDYLIDNNEYTQPIRRKFSKEIVFAGNLSKSKFFKDLIDNSDNKLLLNLYGTGFVEEDNSFIKYKGSFSPEKIVSEIEGSFGLIWDGESASTCSGNLGEYTKYNNPHKLSLYIAASLPVIVWSESAIAKFVLDNKIGFVVDSLFQINKKINDLNESEYNLFISNIDKLSDKIKNGYFTNLAITKILKSIE